jgi:hypothetical protein
MCIALYNVICVFTLLSIVVKPGRPSGSDNSHGPMDIYSTEPGNVESSVNTYEYHGYYTHMPRGRQELVDHRIKKN